uniref:Uncharacterized protein n=1 Tax=Aureoumbra lagunensis TaxID=44058 RepID=A0A7S3K2Z5_9STRA|mmetsp:Transcript_762/g.1079  ORF Transcript_762/g.1079 Transcript_762/m.1079 type:complete len:426 (-) Transcript_762:655-1932(-)
MLQLIMAMMLIDRKEACLSLETGYNPFLLKSRNTKLVPKKGTEVLRLRDASRYFSVIDNWILWKNGTYPHAAQHSQIIASLGCGSEELIKRKWDCISKKQIIVTQSTTTSHNLAAIAKDANTLLCVGGLLLKSSPRLHYLQVSSSSTYSKSLDIFPVLDYDAPGCVEMRSDRSHCELDGRLSLVRFRSDLFLYARANTNPNGGGRFVQVTKISSKHSASWSPFQLIHFAKNTKTSSTIYSEILSQPYLAAERADIYFAAVNQNPVDANTMLALLPTVIRTSTHGPKQQWRGEAAILLALSCDGIHFSPPSPILPATPLGAEINDHPADGFLLDSNSLFFFVHHGVPGTQAKLCDYKKGRLDTEQNKEIVFHGRSSNTTTAAPPPLPPSRVVRYAISLPALANWTRHARHELHLAHPHSCRVSSTT